MKSVQLCIDTPRRIVRQQDNPTTDNSITQMKCFHSIILLPTKLKDKLNWFYMTLILYQSMTVNKKTGSNSVTGGRKGHSQIYSENINTILNNMKE